MLCFNVVLVISDTIFQVAFPSEYDAQGNGLWWWDVSSVFHLFLMKTYVDYICEMLMLLSGVIFVAVLRE